MTEDDQTPEPDEPESQARILDLDGDGVPDAVETVTIEVDHGARGPASVEIVDEIDAEIDDEGTPHHVEVERIIVSEE